MSNSFGGGYFSHPHFLVNLLLLSSLIISGCVQTSRQIDFETVDQGQLSGYHEKEPNFFVISDDDAWKDLYDSYFQGRKYDINFEEYLVIVAFQGEKYTGGYKISIEKISQTDDIIDVVVGFTEPKKGEFVTQATTQPYHTIKLKKAQINKVHVIFRFLEDKGKELKRVNL